MQRDGLVICNVSPTFSFTGEKFGVETPCDDGVYDCFVCAVYVVFFGDGEELTIAIAGSGADGVGLVIS